MLNINVPKRIPVETSVGTFYARFIATGDLAIFRGRLEEEGGGEVNFESLGKDLLKMLICREENGGIDSPLGDDVYLKFSAEDIQKLCHGVALANQLSLPTELGDLEGLGTTMFEKIKSQVEKLIASHKKIFESFQDISAPIREALSVNAADMSSIKEKLLAAVDLRKDIPLAAERIAAMEDKFSKKERVFDTSPPLNLPRFEDTPLGRAALASEESAVRLQEVSILTGQMTANIGQLHNLFLTKVMPEWFKNLKDSGINANKSIRLAKNAIWYSIGASVLLAFVQMGVTQYYRSADAAEQWASKESLLKQLADSSRMNQKLLEEAAKKQSELEVISKRLSDLEGSLASKEGTSVRREK